MARLNIEDCWWTDPRRSALVRKLGEDMADITAIRAWRIAQEFWKHNKGLVPREIFETIPHFEELINAKLAYVQGEFIYVKGSSAYLDWVREKREQASLAGKKSAAARKQKFGSAQPMPTNHADDVVDQSNDSRTELNTPEPSDSLSDSGSNSVSDFVISTSTAAKVASVPDAKFDAKSVDQIFSIIPKEKKDLWIDLYADEDFIIREIKKAFSWYSDNPQKKPKSTRGWLRALSSWLDRGWGFQAKQIKGHAPKSTQLVKNEANWEWANTTSETKGASNE